MLDDDDEVRDRAAFYHYILSSGDRDLMKEYILNDDIRLNMQALERALLAYTQASEAEQARPFDLAAIPLEEPPSESVSDFASIADSSTVGFFEPAIGIGAAAVPGTATSKGLFSWKSAFKNPSSPLNWLMIQPKWFLCIVENSWERLKCTVLI